MGSSVTLIGLMGRVSIFRHLATHFRDSGGVGPGSGSDTFSAGPIIVTQAAFCTRASGSTSASWAITSQRRVSA